MHGVTRTRQAAQLLRQRPTTETRAAGTNLPLFAAALRQSGQRKNPAVPPSHLRSSHPSTDFPNGEAHCLLKSQDASTPTHKNEAEISFLHLIIHRLESQYDSMNNFWKLFSFLSGQISKHFCSRRLQVWVSFASLSK